MALPPFTRKKVLVVAIASLVVVLLAISAAPTATRATSIGTCEDMFVPRGCNADDCRSQCDGLGGDGGKSYCTADHKCCCPGRNVLACDPFSNCSARLSECRALCKKNWDLTPAGAYCNSGSGTVTDRCCCRPNATADDDDAAAGAGNVHRHIGSLHQLDLPH